MDSASTISLVPNVSATHHANARETPRYRQLDPAYDMNPVPTKSEHAIKLDESTAAPNLDAVFKTSGYYRMESSQAKKIIEEIKAEVAKWRTEANHLGLPRSEIELVGTAIMVH